jgi:hypothetical protein
MEDRYCTNCRTELPAGADTCPACGVYAGDVFDGKMPKQHAAGGRWQMGFGLIAVLLLAAGGWWFWYTRYGQFPKADTGPIRVVSDRPGGNVGEAKAIVTLRHHLVEQTKSECLALISRGYSNGFYTFDAVDSCQRTKLGRWRVEAKSWTVSQ